MKLSIWLNSLVQKEATVCFPDRISLPTTISNGKQIEIAHRWNNSGWGILSNEYSPVEE